MLEWRVVNAIVVIAVADRSAQHGPCDRRRVVWGRQTHSPALSARTTRNRCLRAHLVSAGRCQVSARSAISLPSAKRLVVASAGSSLTQAAPGCVPPRPWASIGPTPTVFRLLLLASVGRQIHFVFATLGVAKPRSTSALKAQLRAMELLLLQYDQVVGLPGDLETGAQFRRFTALLGSFSAPACRGNTPCMNSRVGAADLSKSSFNHPRHSEGTSQSDSDVKNFALEAMRSCHNKQL